MKRSDPKIYPAYIPLMYNRWGTRPFLHLPPVWKQRSPVLFDRICKALTARKTKRQVRPLPKQLQAPELPVVMHDNHDGTFTVAPNLEQLKGQSITIDGADDVPVIFTRIDFQDNTPAPATPWALMEASNNYGRTETGDDVLQCNQEAFRNAKQSAVDEAIWLDENGVDFTRWVFELTPDGEHIASASIYLHDPSAVAELIYEASQAHLPNCGGEYTLYRNLNGVIDDALLAVKLPDTGEYLTITGSRRDKAFLEWSMSVNGAPSCHWGETPLFTRKKMRELFLYY